MGKLVAFWSPYIGQAKTTSSLCAIAGSFGIWYPELSIAVSHIKQNSVDLEEKLDARVEENKKMELYKKTGIAALKLYYRQAALTSEKIKRSALPLRMKSIFLYPYAEQEKEIEPLTYRLLTEELKGEFDVVFLDLENGQKKNSLLLLQAADFVVIVLPQGPSFWEALQLQTMDFLEGKKCCILLGGYLKDSKYSKNYYCKKKEWKGETGIAGVIPINNGFFDAMSEGQTCDFFYRNQLVRKKEENYEFIVQTKKAAEFIRKSIFIS